MSHPLDGARFKIVWAEQHLQLFKNDLTLYLDSDPYEFFAEPHGDLVTARCRLTKQPEASLNARIGDCVTPMMAALDYVIWELCGRFAGRRLVPPPAGQDKPSFPIYKDPIRYAKNLHALTNHKRAYNIPTDAMAEIAAVQPYNAGYEPLEWLYALVNQDKHRFPLWTIAQVNATQIAIVQPSGIATGQMIDRGTVGSLTTKAYRKLRDSDSDPYVKVDGEATVSVTLKNVPVPWEPLDRTLEQILKTVANVVPRFDRFFT